MTGLFDAPKSGAKVVLFFDICKKKVQVLEKPALFLVGGL